MSLKEKGLQGNWNHAHYGEVFGIVFVAVIVVVMLLLCFWLVLVCVLWIVFLRFLEEPINRKKCKEHPLCKPPVFERYGAFTNVFMRSVRSVSPPRPSKPLLWAFAQGSDGPPFFPPKFCRKFDSLIHQI